MKSVKNDERRGAQQLARAIVALKAIRDGDYKILAPCGRCREVISDFSEDIWVIMGTIEDPFKVRVSDLLPMKYEY